MVRVRARVRARARVRVKVRVRVRVRVRVTRRYAFYENTIRGHAFTSRFFEYIKTDCPADVTFRQSK